MFEQVTSLTSRGRLAGPPGTSRNWTENLTGGRQLDDPRGGVPILLHLFFVNFIIFLFSDILQNNAKTTKIWQLNFLKNHIFFKIIFFFLIIQLTFLPITFSFLASWFLLIENLNSSAISIIILSLAVYNLAQVIFANKLLNTILCLKNFKT